MYILAQFMTKFRFKTKQKLHTKFHFKQYKQYSTIYTVLKVKQRLNIFQEKTLKLSKHGVILDTFMKLDRTLAKVSNRILIGLTDQGKTSVTIYYKLIVLLKKIVYENSL